MLKMYNKDGCACTVDKEQVAVMKNNDWFLKKPEATPEAKPEAKPVEVKKTKRRSAKKPE